VAHMAEVQPAGGQGPMTKVTVRRFRLRSPARAAALTLGVLVLVLLAAYLPLCAAARQLTASEVWAHRRW
jgi:hypothetical protein